MDEVFRLELLREAKDILRKYLTKNTNYSKNLYPYANSPDIVPIAPARNFSVGVLAQNYQCQLGKITVLTGRGSVRRPLRQVVEEAAKSLNLERRLVVGVYRMGESQEVNVHPHTKRISGGQVYWVSTNYSPPQALNTTGIS